MSVINEEIIEVKAREVTKVDAREITEILVREVKIRKVEAREIR